jgi:NADH-quinone oxidoreductase subunit G
VGALTGASYRFRSRPFDTVSTPSVCEHCAAGCRQRTDHRRGAVTRRLAGDDPAVNEEWNCDKGRWAFTYATQPDRLVSPLVRDPDGRLRPASWAEALAVAARGLLAARGRAGVLPGGRLTLEDAYGYAKFARVALATNDIDMRARPHSAEELQFLAEHVVGRVNLTYDELQQAPAVLLAGFEPEDECPIVFLRLRKAVRASGMPVYSIAAFASKGLEKLSGTLLPTVPGAETTALTELPENVIAALRQQGAVIMIGERLAEVPGALSAAARLAAETGAKLAWIPRRAGERGAVEAGALPNLLPGGRRVGSAEITAEVARVWGVGSLPSDPGYSTSEILAAAAAGDIGALLIGAVDPYDLPDPAAALAAIEAASFVVSLELRVSAVTDRADVVFPVAAVAEKPGTFVNWEGRPGSFSAALAVPSVRTDLQVLAALADEMDVHLGLPDTAAVRREMTILTQSAALSPSPTPAPSPAAQAASPATQAPASQASLDYPGPGRAGEVRALLATWHNLLDVGRMQDGEPNLAGTARAAVARMSAATAAQAGTTDGGKISVATGHGAITVPVEIADMPDRVVWLPTNSAGSTVRRDLGAGHGSVVTVRSAQ